MNRIRAALARLLGLLTKSRGESELSLELTAHLEALAAENIRRGMSREEARQAARREFGGVEQTKELYRNQRGLPFLETFFNDLRFGLRMLRKSPGFTTVAVLTLALGIGANTAIFSVVYGVVLRPLPYSHPDRIVQLTESYRGESDEKDLTYAELQFLQEHRSSFDFLAAFTTVGFNFAVHSDAERVNGLYVSSEYFSVLGIRPILGEVFRPEDDRGDGTRVALLGEALWKRKTGADPNIIGKTIKLNGDPYTVIGVMPAGFERINTPFTHGETDVWAPLALVGRTVGSGQNLAVIGRLRADIPLDKARAQMGTVSEQFRKTFTEELAPESKLDLSRYQAMLSSDLRTILFVLFGAAAFVLLVACANIANLLLARASQRSKEIAVRTALGASRGRLIRQMLSESIMLALLGGLAGLGLAHFALRGLLALSPSDLPRSVDIQLDGWAFGFAVAVALLTGVMFGLAPALKTSKRGVSEVLKESVSGLGAGIRRTRLRTALVIGEIGLSLVLLTGAVLLIETFWHVLRTDPGFEPSHILSMQIWLSGSKYDSSERVSGLYGEVLQKIESLPGVQSAAVVAAGLPMERGGNMPVQVPGKNYERSFGYRIITPGYFRAMGIAQHLGRVIEGGDSAASTPAAVVSESFARGAWPNSNPLGQHLQIGSPGGGQDPPREVVGVVADVKSYLDQPAEPTVYIPVAQAPFAMMKLFEGWFATTIVVRTSSDPLALSHLVADQLRGVDPSIASGHVRSMEQVRSGAVAMRRFSMVLLSLFAALAVLLAAIGISGVIAFSVSQRVREIGIRMALGAHPRQVLKLVLTEGLRLATVGIIVGVVGALALTRVLESYLYEVKPTDPVAFLSTILLLGPVALLACWIPARRATRVDPIVALRYE